MSSTDPSSARHQVPARAGERLLLHPGDGDLRVEHGSSGLRSDSASPAAAQSPSLLPPRRRAHQLKCGWQADARLRTTAAAGSASPATASRGQPDRGGRRSSRQLRTSLPPQDLGFVRSSPRMDPNPRAPLLLAIIVLALGASVAAGAEDDASGISLGRRAGGFLHGLKKDALVEGDHGVALDEVGPGLFDALFASLSMILVSEIGDETFIIAALMAMRHPKSIVLYGALSALYVMTVLSTGLGRIVPNLISRKHTNSAATVLYLFFGLRLLYIAWKSDPNGSQKKEMEEVEEKLESGQGKSTIRSSLQDFVHQSFWRLVCYLMEAFILTFLAEWGDQSQIATIALATHKNAIGVAVGASLGHTVCTSLAVVGGSMLASKISQQTVATIGGVLFLGFSVSSYFYPPL